MEFSLVMECRRFSTVSGLDTQIVTPETLIFSVEVMLLNSIISHGKSLNVPWFSETLQIDTHAKVRDPICFRFDIVTWQSMRLIDMATK